MAKSTKSPVAGMSAMERRYQAESALSTLTRAQEIQKDRRLMSDVAKLAKEQVQSLQKVVPQRAAPKAKGRGK